LPALGGASQHDVADLHPQQFGKRIGAVSRAAPRRVVARIGEHGRPGVQRLRLCDDLRHRPRRHAELELPACIPVMLRDRRGGFMAVRERAGREPAGAAGEQAAAGRGG